MERWTLNGEHASRIEKSGTLKAQRAPDVYETPDGYDCGWVTGHNQSKSVWGPDARLCADVKF